MRRRLLLPFLLLPLLPATGGCALVSSQAPPECAWFDVMVHPGGGIPATVGYYAGVVAWSPVGLILGGLLPYPADEAVARYPGHWLGTGVGCVLGAPFHLLAWPFGPSGPPAEEGPDATVPPTSRTPAGPR